MTSSLTDIRTALKTAINGIDALNVYDTVTDVVQTPAAVIEPFTADYTVAMNRGGDTYCMNIMVLVADTDPANSQFVLDQYVTGRGDKSIREFLFANCTLGLDDVDATVMSMKGYNGSPDVAGIKMIGAILRVNVVVT